jgi:hypothetical protein
LLLHRRGPGKDPPAKTDHRFEHGLLFIPRIDNGFSGLVLVGAARVVTLILCRNGQFWRFPQAALLDWTPPIVDRISLRGLVVAGASLVKIGYNYEFLP